MDEELRARDEPDGRLRGCVSSSDCRLSLVGLGVEVDDALCWEVTGKAPIKVRWVDVNKGDDDKPNHRSRIVAKEIRTDSRPDLFAATPPLEAIKILLSAAVTEGLGFTKGQRLRGMKLDFIDVRRAYFQAKARRSVYVKLPDEDYQEGMVGKLLRSMYGARDAAQNWEAEYSEFMESIGLKRGIASPCVLFHSERNIRCVILLC